MRYNNLQNISSSIFLIILITIKPIKIIMIVVILTLIITLNISLECVTKICRNIPPQFPTKIKGNKSCRLITF